jgi:gas vesicle protein
MSENKEIVSKGTLGIVGLIAGIAAGVGLGFIFAPKSGKETREDISAKAKVATKDLKSKGIEIKDQLIKKFDELKVTASEKKDEAMSKIQKVSDNIKKEKTESES